MTAENNIIPALKKSWNSDSTVDLKPISSNPPRIAPKEAKIRMGVETAFAGITARRRFQIEVPAGNLEAKL